MHFKFAKRSLAERNETRNRVRHVFHTIRHNRFLFISILLMILIFLFSSQTREESRKLSGKFYEFITMNNKLFTFINIRKLAHFTLFGLLGASIFTHLRFMYGFKSKIKYYVLAFVFTLVYAGIDELHQYFVNGRGCTILDVGIDCLGCVVALMINFVVISLLERKKRNP